MKKVLAISLALNIILIGALGWICVDRYMSEYNERCFESLKHIGRTVYITPTGQRYHLDAECGGKNSFESTVVYAVAKGLTPCLKCAD